MPTRSLRLLRGSLLCLLLTIGGGNAARGYDMDCKAILCLAGGFPVGCADAKAYVLRRLRSFPPKPPIGHCEIGSDAEAQVLRGGEPYLGCAEGFSRIGGCDPREGCESRCVAAVHSRASAFRLARAASRSLESRSEGRACVECVRVFEPDPQSGRAHYEVSYPTPRRRHSRWIQLRIRQPDGDWVLSPKFWW